MPDKPLDTAPKPGYPEPYGMLLATLEKQTASWRHQLETPSPEEIVWQPYENGHSIGALMLHIAEVETYWIETVCLGREMSHEELELYMSAQTDPFKGIWPAPPNHPFDYYLGILARVRAKTLESVKEFGEPT